MRNALKSIIFVGKSKVFEINEANSKDSRNITIREKQIDVIATLDTY